MNTFTLIVESALHGKGIRLDSEDVAAVSEYVAAIRTGFAVLGLKERHGPDLDRVTAHPSYIWRNLAALNSEVVWWEAHGSAAQGLAQLPLEEIARIHDADRGDDWERLSCGLLFFGSCFTARSDLWDLLPRLVDRPCVVVGSERAVRFTDGRYYPAIIEAWGENRYLDPERIAKALGGVAPELFVADVVTPEFD